MSNEICTLDCPFDLPQGHRIADHPRMTNEVTKQERTEETTAYNAAEIISLTQELLGPVERERLHKSPPWFRSVVHGLIQRIANLRAMNTRAAAPTEQWRDIESAPKDGTEIILGHGNGVWFDEWVVDSEYDGGGYWMMCDQWSEPEIPSHWQPAPLPPAPEGD